MSTLFSQARVRVPRFAESAVQRARLTVVPQRALGRTRAPRAPFAVLVVALLAGGVVGLLMFNTSMQQRSFQATALQQRMTELAAREQALNMELDALRDPQHLAAAAKELGMVAPAQPAFVRLVDGKVLGNPKPAGIGDAVRINPLPPPKPEEFSPPPVVVKVPATGAEPGATGEVPNRTNSAPGTGGASTNGTTAPGRKNPTDQAGPGATP